MTEMPEITTQEKALSAADRISLAPADITPIQAADLALEYFRDKQRIFVRRLVALRSVVPDHVRTAWDAQAEKYAQISQAIDKGDTRPVKEFVMRAGMDLNKQAQNPDKRHMGKFGSSLYTVGSRMQVSVGRHR